ncbi:MAG: amidohydrolase family protein, partial [Thermoplasmata archaeon]|nr:amidohydrolase family protein [Thermoplasmata archaeon]
ILPSFVDAHTHLADGFILDPLPLDLDEAVSPPDGMKHRGLERASREELRGAFSRALERLAMEGVGTVCDFREGGPAGVELVEGCEDTMKLILLGRPGPDGDEGSVAGGITAGGAVAGDGIGLSSILGQEETAKGLAALCKDSGKLFAFHHSEATREPMGPVLDLGPDFIVHGTHCTMEDIEELTKAGIGVVVCPGMNALFGAVPPIRKMLDAGMDVALGTDNAMAHPPSMLEEMRRAYLLVRLDHNPLSPENILDMAITGGKKVLRLGKDIGLKKERSLVIFRKPPRCTAKNAANVVVNHIEAKDVLFLNRGERRWKNSKRY